MPTNFMGRTWLSHGSAGDLETDEAKSPWRAIRPTDPTPNELKLSTSSFPRARASPEMLHVWLGHDDEHKQDPYSRATTFLTQQNVSRRESRAKTNQHVLSHSIAPEL